MIVVAIVVGVLALRSTPKGSNAAAPPSSSTTTSSTTTTTTAPSAAERSSVKVLVANDSTTNGVAAAYTTLLQHAGWSLLAPANAKPPPRATSAVYYAPNRRADADALAASLGIAASEVFPLSPATPIADTTGIDLVLVVGADLAAKTPPSTVPPTTTTTRPKTTTTRAG